MKNIVLNFVIIMLTLSIQTGTAQVNIGGEPLAFSRSARIQTPAVRLPELNRTVIEQEDIRESEEGLPPRFGIPHEVNYNLQNSGAWETLPNEEGRVWRLSIHCSEAVSINLLYDAFWLPTGARLYIYNDDHSHFIGGFSERNNNTPRGESTGYATGIVYGDKITLEYFEPVNVEQEGEISISSIVHGYKSLNFNRSAAFGDSGPCQVNINCPDGNNWQGAKTSVALIVVGGTRWCTGSMMNTRTGDFLPYFLTANHCLDGWAIPTPIDAVSNPVASNWMFYWNYEAPACANPATDPNWSSTTGAYLVANKADSDFALFYLAEDPFRDAGLGLTYNGWDPGESPPATGAGIHHPSGDVKKISLYQQVPTNNANCAPNNTWSVIFQHPSGSFSSTEPGSSGSPLYDGNGRVIGQLWGGVNPTNCGGGPVCTDPANDMSYYGKFSTSWDDGGGAMRRLKDWLDPTCNINFTVASNISSGVSNIYADQQVTSNKLVSGSNTYVTYNGGQAVRLTEGFRASGNAKFRATNFDCNNATTLSRINSETGGDETFMDSATPQIQRMNVKE